MSQILRDARKYEEMEERQIAEDTRPDFHLSARVGWMNDPNGFSYYKGMWHLFYQYHPYHSHWGPMHWGHAVSKDLVHWQYLPAALAPDTDYDRDGCFSGSAVVTEDGRHLLMYTGVVNETQPDGTQKGVQTQCMAVGDGLNYEKYEGNPVLDREDIPKDGSRYDFRDPKMWITEDGNYQCVVGNCSEEGKGQIVLFESEDGSKWERKSVLAKNDGSYGKMWECPDFFELDGKHLLVTSPQDMLPQGLEYHNGNGTMCQIGTYDKETFTFRPEKNQSIDYGIDFYAPQTAVAPDGRRIMIGWMQNWDTCNLHSPEQPWFGQMSIPRELAVKNNRLYQWPVKELESLRTDRVEYKQVHFSDLLKLEGIKGRKVDLLIDLKPETGKELYRKFAVRFAQNEAYHTAVSFRPHESVVKIDRKFSGSRRAIIHQRRCEVADQKGSLKLRIILDAYSAEVFVNDGEQVLTITMYTDLEADGISFFVDGCAEMDVVKYTLGSKENNK